MCITYNLFVCIFQNSFKCYVIVVTARVWYVFLSILLVLENCNFRSLKSPWILSFQFAMNPEILCLEIYPQRSCWISDLSLSCGCRVCSGNFPQLLSFLGADRCTCVWAWANKAVHFPLIRMSYVWLSIEWSTGRHAASLQHKTQHMIDTDRSSWCWRRLDVCVRLRRVKRSRPTWRTSLYPSSTLT